MSELGSSGVSHSLSPTHSLRQLARFSAAPRSPTHSLTHFVRLFGCVRLFVRRRFVRRSFVRLFVRRSFVRSFASFVRSLVRPFGAGLQLCCAWLHNRPFPPTINPHFSVPVAFSSSMSADCYVRGTIRQIDLLRPNHSRTTWCPFTQCCVAPGPINFIHEDFEHPFVINYYWLCILLLGFWCSIFDG